MNEFAQPSGTCTPVPQAPYEAPRVERLLTPEDLEQEFLYGGPPATPPE
ncbi:MAG TPA: hypothetical protein VHO73_11220 [Methylomirabilota bacterium]|jgi:hypothetical protein|nr:hypothetical protein [Methylomirabilota bacterium]